MCCCAFSSYNKTQQHDQPTLKNIILAHKHTQSSYTHSYIFSLTRNQEWAKSKQKQQQQSCCHHHRKHPASKILIHIYANVCCPMLCYMYRSSISILPNLPPLIVHKPSNQQPPTQITQIYTHTFTLTLHTHTQIHTNGKPDRQTDNVI